MSNFESFVDCPESDNQSHHAITCGENHVSHGQSQPIQEDFFKQVSTHHDAQEIGNSLCKIVQRTPKWARNKCVACQISIMDLSQHFLNNNNLLILYLRWLFRSHVSKNQKWVQIQVFSTNRPQSSKNTFSHKNADWTWYGRCQSDKFQGCMRALSILRTLLRLFFANSTRAKSSTHTNGILEAWKAFSAAFTLWALPVPIIIRR